MVESKFGLSVARGVVVVPVNTMNTMTYTIGDLAENSGKREWVLGDWSSGLNVVKGNQYPGGGVEPCDDIGAIMRLRGRAPERAMIAAAKRETFQEMGVEVGPLNLDMIDYPMWVFQIRPEGFALYNVSILIWEIQQANEDMLRQKATLSWNASGLINYEVMSKLRPRDRASYRRVNKYLRGLM